MISLMANGKGLPKDWGQSLLVEVEISNIYPSPASERGVLGEFHFKRRKALNLTYPTQDGRSLE
jgi:hypothetical protein